jgi:hypothetical protein
MKFLILLIFISCGKDKVPPAMDLYDADGDSIANEFEAKDDKFVAQVLKLNEFRGMMRIDFSEREFEEIPFSTKIDTHKDILRLLLKTRPRLDPHFGEWATIRLKRFVKKEIQEKKIHSIRLRFESNTQHPTAIYYLSTEGLRRLKSWDSDMTLYLNSQEVENILLGKGRFVLANQWFEDHAQQVSARTYRVYMQKADGPSVFHVSKALPFNDFLKQQGIDVLRNIEQEDLFFDHQEKATWWYRKLGDDHVLVRSDRASLQKNYLSFFNTSQFYLRRTNGLAEGKVTFENLIDKKIYLKMKVLRKTRTFTENSFKRTHLAGRTMHIWDCRYDYRETVAQPLHDVLDLWSIPQLSFKTDGENFAKAKNGFLIQAMDTHGPYFIAGVSGIDQLSFQLGSFAKEEYLPVGIYNAKCNGGAPLEKVSWSLQHPEEMTELIMTSFVEQDEE